MEQKRETIIVDSSLSPEEVMERAANYFAAGVPVVEIDLSQSVLEEKCQEILDYLEGAFSFKRKEITLKISVLSAHARGLVNMVRHSDVITEILISGPEEEAQGLYARFLAVVLPSTKIRLQS